MRTYSIYKFKLHKSLELPSTDVPRQECPPVRFWHWSVIVSLDSTARESSAGEPKQARSSSKARIFALLGYKVCVEVVSLVEIC